MPLSDHPRNSLTARRPTRWLQHFALIAGGTFLIAGLFFVKRWSLESLLPTLYAQATDWRQNTLALSGYFCFLCTLCIALGVPRLLFFSAGSYFFGFWLGLTLSLICAALGSWITFTVIRRWFRQRFSSVLARQQQLSALSTKTPNLATVAIIRLLPISNLLGTAGLALSQVRIRTFLFGTVAGFIPQGLLGALAGSGLSNDNAAFTPMIWGSTLTFGLIYGVWRLTQKTWLKRV